MSSPYINFDPIAINVDTAFLPEPELPLPFVETYFSSVFGKNISVTIIANAKIFCINAYTNAFVIESFASIIATANLI